MTPHESAEQAARKWLLRVGLAQYATRDELTAESYDRIEALTEFILTQRAEVLEEAAQILDNEVVDHRREHGEHQYCEDYGCHYIETLAGKIRQQAKEREG